NFIDLYNIHQLIKYFFLADAISKALKLLWVLSKHIPQLVNRHTILIGLCLYMLIYIIGFYFNIIKLFLQLFIQKEPLGIAPRPILNILLIFFFIKTRRQFSLCLLLNSFYILIFHLL